MPFDSTQFAFRKLQRLIRDGHTRVVPFIGAGLSSYGPVEERLPLWSQLLTSLRQRGEELGILQESESARIAELIATGDVIAATDRLIAELRETQFRIFIRDMLDVNGREIPPAITELACVAWSLIVTTNLDEFIEVAWRCQQKESLEVVTHDDTSELAEAIAGSADHPTLAKLHGTVDRHRTWVLTGAHYRLLLERKPAYVRALETLFLRSVFFVGYGINDADIELLLSHIKAIFPAGVGNRFALLSGEFRGSEKAKYLITEYGIQPIWYQVDRSRYDAPDGGHGEVLECVQLLVRTWVEENKHIPITLKYFPELETEFVGRDAELSRLGELLLAGAPKNVQVIGFGGEGKTSLVQTFLAQNKASLFKAGYTAVFACTFYRADVGRFISDAYIALDKAPRALDIASKVSALCKIFRSEQILLFLDGLEAVQSADGSIANPYLKDILSAAQSGKTTVVVTSRQTLKGDFVLLPLEQLSESDALRVLKSFGLRAPHRDLIHAIRTKIGCHALSVRIAASFVRFKGLNELRSLDELSMTSIPEEADPLRANKEIGRASCRERV